MEKTRLAELQQNRYKINQQATDLTEQIQELTLKRAEYLKELKKTDNLIKQITTEKEIHVSEHAVVRYLEREAGIDVATVREILASEALKKQVKVLGGTGTFPLESGNGKVRLENFTVVTYIE